MGYVIYLRSILYNAVPRLTLTLIVCISIHVCACAQQPAGSGSTLTLSGNVTLADIFSAIQAQMDLTVTYEYSVVDRNQKVRVNFRNASLQEVMERILRGMPVGWVLVKGQVFLYENKTLASEKKVEELITLSGSIKDPEGNPVPGATVVIKGSLKGDKSNAEGRFRIEEAPTHGILEISCMGYLGRQFRLEGEKNLPPFVLMPAITQIEPVTVVSTGYQDLPKERSTGSFVFIDSALLQRRVGMNILDRLEGVTSGLLSYKTGTAGVISNMPTGVSLGLSLRGLSTLSPNKVNPNPLIILDNFPYEGDIRNINPNDIESVTVLKDAASASIWGAKSGNGVIVLSTKKGKYGQKMNISFNTNLTVVNKPDLYYDRNYMQAGDYIEVETILFNKGYFNADINNRNSRPPVSPVVEILARQRDGLISDAEANEQINSLKFNDLRNDLLKYVYQRGVSQQYQMSIRGGIKDFAYYLSLGYDRKKDNLIRNGTNRQTITSSNTYRPVKKLELTAFLNYSQSTVAQNNELGHGRILVGGEKYNLLFPYARLVNNNGSAASVIKDYRANYVDSMRNQGFLDWHYRPLDEIGNAKKHTGIHDLLLRAGVKYEFTSFLNAEVQFQNERQSIVTKDYRSEKMYDTRNLINKFSVYDPIENKFTYNFPRGGMLRFGNYDWTINDLRVNLNYKQKLKDHFITAIAGSEIRELSAEGTERGSIGYLNERGTAATNLNISTLYPVNPVGVATLNSAFSMSESDLSLLNRFVSYYVNAGYSYKMRYDFTISARKDGANLFGVKTNHRLVPLWSIGMGWDLDQEPFYKLEWMHNLRIRASYGFNGNVYNGSAYLTGTRFTDPLTGAPTIINIVPANEELGWERVKIVNIGTDFSILNSRISGTIEYFRKEGLDLVEQVQNLPQTGAGTVSKNSASTLTKGVDATLSGKIIDGNFNWTSTIISNVLKDKITKYSVNPIQSSSVVSTEPLGLLYVVDKPLQGIFSYKWGGLDPKNGDPLGYHSGGISKNYSAIVSNYHPDSLVFHGSATPTVYGSFRNDFSYKGLNISFNIIYKFGYYFRRPGINLNYQDILNGGMNIDYQKRWKEPGDEHTTDIPSLSYPVNIDRSGFYQYSEILVARGDHVRLQDIRFGYVVPLSRKGRSYFKKMEIYSYMSNIGIIWRNNKYKLDPDMYLISKRHDLPDPFSVSLGMQVNF